MNLLVLTNNPSRASFKQRIGAYFDVLRAKDINCEVAKLPPGFLKRLTLFKHAREFDGVFLHKKCLNFFDAAWLRKYGRKIIYNFDDAVMYSDKTPEKYSPLRFRPWQRCVKLADMVIVGSTWLAELAKGFNSAVEILPIGLNIRDYKIDRPCKNDDKIRLVWIGSKSTLNYLAQLKPVLEEIGLRFSNVILRIICDDFFDLDNMSVEKCLWSDASRFDNLAACDIGLAPLPDNRFTQGKCSFKVLEYSASGLPVVASPVGTNADYVRDGVTGLLATGSEQWINSIARLVENPQLRETMGQQGRKYAEEFDVGVIGAKFAGLIEKCLKNSC